MPSAKRRSKRPRDEEPSTSTGLQPGERRFQWVGEGTPGAGGTVEYAALLIETGLGGEETHTATVHVGDNVLVRVNAAGQYNSLSVARVERLWHGEGDMWMTSRWYYHPHEMPALSVAVSLAHEVCPTQHSDEGMVRSIVGPVQVRRVPVTCPDPAGGLGHGHLSMSMRVGTVATAVQALNELKVRRTEAQTTPAPPALPGDAEEAAALAAQYVVRYACDYGTKQLYPAPGDTMEEVWAALARTGHASAVSSSSGVARAVAGQEGGTHAHAGAGVGGSFAGEAVSAEGDGGDPFGAACEALRLSAIPPALPCREEEREDIKHFVGSAVQQGGLGCALYVSGMPGTGKTATVSEVVRELQTESQRGQDMPPFMYVEVNAMKLSHPYQLYTTLWNAIARQSAVGTGGASRFKGKRTTKALPTTTSTQRAVQFLDAHFTKPSTHLPTVVLLVDELDYLVTRKQTVLYNLFEWPTRPASRLVVLGIANTMDLPERMLPKVHSRLGMGRLVFQPYTRQQICTIIADRLSALQAFDTKAVELAARKVASVSGDIRRALQVCRAAVEQARKRRAAAPGAASRKAVRVGVADVNAAARAMAASHAVLSVKQAAPLERLLLLSLALCLRSAGTEGVPGSMVVQRAAGIRRTALGRSDEVPHRQWLQCMGRLLDCRLCRAEKDTSRGMGAATNALPAQLKLNVQVDDVALALREHAQLGTLAQQLL